MQLNLTRSSAIAWRTALCFRLIIILLLGIWLFNYMLRVGFLANTHGKERTQV